MTPISEENEERTILVSRARAVESAPDPLGRYLVIVGGDQLGRRVEIGATPVTIGRDAKQTLVLVDSEVSRLHARVSLVLGEVVAEDLGSTNGTYLDEVRLTAPVSLQEGRVLRTGSHLLKYERRSRRDVERTEELDRDLQRASNYVLSLLPVPLVEGPVRTEWRFVPSAELGGDAFGYDWLDPDRFVLYLIDVSGHGVGAAMHTVSALNVLRQRALPGVDFADPAAVLSSLNTRFPMDAHGGMYFTMWYGFYRVSDRRLTYSAAGHHPAFLVPSGGDVAQPVGHPSLMIGVIPETVYRIQDVTVPPASTLYLFSDGVFEITTIGGVQWTLADFVPAITAAALPGVPEAERLYRTVSQAAGRPSFDDDFSLITFAIP